ncbi:choline transporter-like protein 4 [Platysternon megacephalum]|uniref:Choline transporter-like protein 4 n=1 Tax=Platysternon megacephalum TaxID=55544 RepID=A0A4D9DRG2_9SAUR|nr:choline transporter-like protein 4 [Platysternon megacephalum]
MAARLRYCSRRLQHFFCDLPPLLHLSCTRPFSNELAAFTEGVLVQRGEVGNLLRENILAWDPKILTVSILLDLVTLTIWVVTASKSYLFEPQRRRLGRIHFFIGKRRFPPMHATRRQNISVANHHQQRGEVGNLLRENILAWDPKILTVSILLDLVTLTIWVVTASKSYLFEPQRRRSRSHDSPTSPGGDWLRQEPWELVPGEDSWMPGKGAIKAPAPPEWKAAAPAPRETQTLPLPRSVPPPMAGSNRTGVTDFLLVGFPSRRDLSLLLFSLALPVFLLGLAGNLGLATVSRPHSDQRPLETNGGVCLNPNAAPPAPV